MSFDPLKNKDKDSTLCASQILLNSMNKGLILSFLA